MDLLDRETSHSAPSVVCAANSPESCSTINQRGALGSLGASHLLTEIISAAPRTGPETQSEGEATRSLARFGCCAPRGESWSIKNSTGRKARWASAQARNYIYRYLLPPAKSRARERGDDGARIINSAIPPRLFPVSVGGSTTFHPLP